MSKQSVLVVNVLDAGEMGRLEDLSDFDKGQIIVARRLGRSISEAAKGASTQQWWVFTDTGLMRGKTGCWVPKAHRCARATKAILPNLN